MQVVLFVLQPTVYVYLILNPLLRNVILVREKRQLFFSSMNSLADMGRVTYAEMLYRSNLIAYVPADHVTGLASNVGKRKQGEREES